MPDSVSNSDIDAILRRQISSVAAQEKCDRNDPNEISAYLEGALSSKRVADFEQHLVNCTICRRAVVELRALDDESNLPEIEDAVSDTETDSTAVKDISPGFFERLHRLLFGTGGNGYMWRPAAALVMILLIVAAPAVLFMRQSGKDTLKQRPGTLAKSEKTSPSTDTLADSNDSDKTGSAATFSTPSSKGYVDAAPNAAVTTQIQQPSPGDTAVSQAGQQPTGVAGGVSSNAGSPAAAQAPTPPPPPPPVVTAAENKDAAPQNTVADKQIRDEELNRVQREVQGDLRSNQAYASPLTWNVSVSMTPVENRAYLADGALSSRQGEANAPDRGGGARGANTEQPPASAKPASRAKTEDAESNARTDDAKRKEAPAKKSAESTVPYDKRVGQILKARFDKLLEDKVRSGTGVTVKIRIGPDGSVISLKDGKVPDGDILKRSSNDVINTAVMKAIAEGKLPAFGETEKNYSQIILTIKFEPTVN
jgi:hypothetical protein